ncbi:hypothetical protein [Microbacterium marinilacus]|uniref:Uncharacterized protein n=1 Tax=Microbacterium marinilacus TaxID=415209 RepID=A0ABP7BAC4_9MICO|nr:hypothetical protein [Microbacterium marinilacus]MBY0687006.1 hypothetical protein [Microbacterium marinilacus]
MTLKPTNHPELQRAAEGAVPTRPARPDDDPGDVLELGRDFHYLAEDATGALIRTNQPPTGLPTRIIVDAPDRGFTFLAIHAVTGRLYQVEAPQGRCAFPEEVR